MSKRNSVLVTGAGGTLGRAVATYFEKKGYEVFATGRPGACLKVEFPQWAWMEMELADAQSISMKLTEAFGDGAPDALVHCAGGFRWSHLTDISLEDIDFLLDANLRSSLYLTRELGQRMKRTGRGSVVLVGAKPVLMPGAGCSAYAASKAGVHALVRAVADEWRADKLKINAVLPTIIDTPANREAMPDADPKTWVAPEELAKIIFDLCSEENRSVHGALLEVAARV